MSVLGSCLPEKKITCCILNLEMTIGLHAAFTHTYETMSSAPLTIHHCLEIEFPKGFNVQYVQVHLTVMSIQGPGDYERQF